MNTVTKFTNKFVKIFPKIHTRQDRNKTKGNNDQKKHSIVSFSPILTTTIQNPKKIVTASRNLPAQLTVVNTTPPLVAPCAARIASQRTAADYLNLIKLAVNYLKKSSSSNGDVNKRHEMINSSVCTILQIFANTEINLSPVEQETFRTLITEVQTEIAMIQIDIGTDIDASIAEKFNEQVELLEAVK